jgi:hypothetical protein
MVENLHYDLDRRPVGNSFFSDSRFGFFALLVVATKSARSYKNENKQTIPVSTLRWATTKQKISTTTAP